MFLRKYLLGVMFALAMGTVMQADQPTLSIQQQATLVMFGVEVSVVVNCQGSTAFEVNVAVRQGDMANGGRQVVPVFVPGEFTPGAADATAVLACNQLLEAIRAGQSIKITE